MNAARPVLVSDEVGCALDLVQDGDQGYVFPARDVTALTECLSRILSSPETAARMGERARERMRSWSFEEDVRGLRAALAYVTRKACAGPHDSVSSAPFIVQQAE